MSYLRNIVLFICLFFSLTSFGQNESQAPQEINSFLNPFFTQLQFGGNLGSMSLGFGKYFYSDNFLLSLHYGRTPSDNEEGKTVHSFSLKNSYFLRGLNWDWKLNFLPEIGWAISYSGNTPFPILIHAGIRAEKEFNEDSFISRASIFGLIGTNGMWVTYKVDNNTVPLTDILNLSFGLQVDF